MPRTGAHTVVTSVSAVETNNAFSSRFTQKNSPRGVVVPRASAHTVVTSAVETNNAFSWCRARVFVASSLVATVLFTTALPPAAHAIDFEIMDPSVKEYMDSRDDAMRMKCEGGMMDCDGDRRTYAKAQSANFVRRNSGEVFEPPPCKVEEACTTDIVGAAIAGLSGLTTSEKLEKMGKDGDAVNATRPYFGNPVGNRVEQDLSEGK